MHKTGEGQMLSYLGKITEDQVPYLYVCRENSGSQSWTGRQRLARGGPRILLRGVSLFWGHEKPIKVLRCHDAQTGGAHIRVVLLKLIFALNHLGILLKCRLI